MLVSALLLALAAAGQTDPTSVSALGACFQAKVSIPAGSILDPQSFEPIACPKKGAVPLRYDVAARVTRPTRSLKVGDIVHAWPDAAPDHVRPGDKLTARVDVGAVHVERTVTALQPAAPGQGLFIRAADGKILSARYESSHQ